MTDQSPASMPASRARAALQLPSLAVGLTLLAALGVCYRGYLYYSVALHDTLGYQDVLHGTANAPDQYRIGVVYAALWLTHLGLRMSRAFGLLDVLGSTLSVLLLAFCLRISTVYRSATPAVRALGAMTFSALVLFCMTWVLWYQKVETLPTSALVALLLWLWTPPLTGNSTRRRWRTASALLLVTLAQALVRADIALLVAIGVGTLTFTRHGDFLALPRTAARAVALLGTALALATQLVLMKIVYPHATYAGVPMLMGLHDWKEPMLWFAFLIFIAPFAWVGRQVLQLRLQQDAAGLAFLLAAAGYVLLWVAMGRLDEVRIFIPMGLALAPLAAQAVMRTAEPDPASSL